MSIKELMRYLKKECALCLSCDEARVDLGKILSTYCYDSGFRLVFLYRLSRYLHLKYKDKRLLWKIPKLLVQHEIKITSSMISPNADIAEGLRIYYGTGIIIGSNVKIGKNAVLLNGITIGNTHPGASLQKTLIGDNVYIGSGAKILGEISLGDGVKVGANAVVLTSCGSNITLVGIPAREAKKDGI